MEHREDIEQLFKKLFENFESDVRPDTWMNIQNGLNAAIITKAAASSKPAATVITAGKSLSAYIISAAIAVVAITAAVIYFNNDTPVDSHKPLINDLIISEQSNPVTNEVPPTNENNLPLQSAEVKREKKNQPSPDLPSTSNKTPEVTQRNYASAVDNAIDKTPSITSNINSSANKQPDVIVASRANDTEQVTPQFEKENSDNADSESTIESLESQNHKDTDIENKSSDQLFGTVPDVITPNEDGKNDIFILEANSLLSLKVSIYDRAGKLIHQWNNPHGFWDGKLENGNFAQAGTYFFTAFGLTTDNKPITKKGTFHLITK